MLDKHQCVAPEQRPYIRVHPFHRRPKVRTETVPNHLNYSASASSAWVDRLNECLSPVRPAVTPKIASIYPCPSFSSLAPLLPTASELNR